ncbi:hypothetical protein [Gloeocapsa sp. PCC 73106]|uniref:hypothetical protein n=1 Tax=Gloeocapsa sp. PCC 73106 TaxID=102232 RepID=UPI0002AD16EF|nr:hypothetical protein [Gloeocapsa sp. PCC 73106]ELR97396.1 hypothetical protein GLO73106DRAFT_00012060 [Gloeocapsa sp. PCC 73106]
MDIKPQFVTKRDAQELTGFSCETLKKWRLTGKLTEGIHWIRVGNSERVVRYNALLLIDFLQNYHDLSAHQRAIDAYLASLPSNQPRKSKARKTSGR